jgi:hypothetical protein
VNIRWINFILPYVRDMLSPKNKNKKTGQNVMIKGVNKMSKINPLD